MEKDLSVEPHIPYVFHLLISLEVLTVIAPKSITTKSKESGSFSDWSPS